LHLGSDAIRSPAPASFLEERQGRSRSRYDRAPPAEDHTDAQAKRAFEGLAKESIPSLFGMARRLTGDGAEDLVQECLMRAYRSFESLADRQAAGVDAADPGERVP
jgi:hypothetical protein